MRGVSNPRPDAPPSDRSRTLIFVLRCVARGGRRRKCRERLRAEASCELNQRLDLLFRCRGQRQLNSLLTGLRRRTPAEYRIVRRPRRQTVDLGADHAVEEIHRLLRKVERPKQDLRRTRDAVSIRLPRNAACQSAGRAGLGRPLAIRNETSASGCPFGVDCNLAVRTPVLSPPSTMLRPARISADRGIDRTGHRRHPLIEQGLCFR